MKSILISAAALAFAASATPALAAPTIDFDIAGAPTSSVNADITGGFCIGCSVSTSLDAGLDNNIFSLEEGETETFDFFDITVGGLFGAAEVGVEATLGFDLPTGLSVMGQGEGGFITLFGILSGGILEWDDIPMVTLSNGSTFLVDFSDILAFGIGNSATVTASITAVDAVPEPAALGLLGLGLLGLAATRRRSAAL